MREIPEDIINDVNKIAEKLVVYKNIGLENKKNDDRLLTNVVTKITRMGYDIEAIPFKLTKF